MMTGTTRLPAGAASTSNGGTDPNIASANAENHRQLELKWISAMSAIPSAEAAKSRKIKKLVIDGIPGSVRGVVW